MDEEGFQGFNFPTLSRRMRRTRLNARSLHFASLSLWESEATVGMTMFRKFVEGVRVVQGEFGYGGAAERFEVGTTGQGLTHFVGDGSHVGSGGDARAEAGAVGIDGEDGELLDLDLHGFEDNFFLLAG